MSSATPTLVIPFAASELPTCSPNLMPFHIDYTGPAAVSAFMRVDKAKPDEETREKDATVEVPEEIAVEGSSVDVEMTTNVSISVDELAMPKTDPEADIKASVPATPTTDPESQTLSVTTESTLVVESQMSLASDTTQILPPVLEDADKRFVSTFRGRTIHGLTIDLPVGYGGLVLQVQEDANSSSVKEEGPKNSSKGTGSATNAKTKGSAKGNSKEKETAKPRGRLTRSAISKRVEVISVDDEDEVMADPDRNEPIDEAEASTEPLDDRPVRKLVPKAQFSSFTLWHADRPVDKGSDEYYRTLTEWIDLSHEIHRTDL